MKDGGAAFPTGATQAYQHDAGCGDTYTVRGTNGQPGMSLRDYFAAKALPTAWAIERERTAATTFAIEEATVATGAYAMADALLKAREKT